MRTVTEFSWRAWVRPANARRCRWADYTIDLRDTGNSYPPVLATAGFPDRGRDIKVGRWTVTPHRAMTNEFPRSKYQNAALVLTDADGLRIGLMYAQYSGYGFPYAQLQRTLPYLSTLLRSPRSSTSEARARRAEVAVHAAAGFDALRAMVTTSPEHWQSTASSQAGLFDEFTISQIVPWVSVGAPSRAVALALSVNEVHPWTRTGAQFDLIEWVEHGFSDMSAIVPWADLGVRTAAAHRRLQTLGFTDPEVVSDWLLGPITDLTSPFVTPDQLAREWAPLRDQGWAPDALRLMDTRSAQAGSGRLKADEVAKTAQRWRQLVGDVTWAEAFLRAGYEIAEVSGVARERWPSKSDLDALTALAS